MPADPTAYFEPIIDFRMTNVILPVVTYSIEQTGIWRRINLNARPGATDWIMEWLTSVWRFVGPHNIVPVAQSDAALTFRRKMIDNGIVYIAVSPSWYWSAYHQILDYYAHPVLAATQAIIEPYFSMYAPLTRNWIMLSLQYDSFYAPVYTDQQKKEVAWKLVCFNGLYNGTSTLPHMKDERGFFNTFARRPCACLLQWVVDKGATGRVPTRTSPAPSIQYSSTVHAPEQLYKPDPVHDALASQNLNAEYTAIADTILERINVPPSVIFQEYLKYRANYLNVSDATSFIDYFITLHADKHR
jgi:hypothetical protein